MKKIILPAALSILLLSIILVSAESDTDKFDESNKDTWIKDGKYRDEVYSKPGILNSPNFDWSKADMSKLQGNQEMLKRIQWNSVPDNKVGEITNAGNLDAKILQNMGTKFGSLKPDVRNQALRSATGITAQGTPGIGYIATFTKNQDNLITLTNSVNDPSVGEVGNTITLSEAEAKKFTVEYLPNGGFKLIPAQQGVVDIGGQNLVLQQGSIATVQGDKISIQGKGSVDMDAKGDKSDKIENNAGTVNLQRNSAGDIISISSESGDVSIPNLRDEQKDFVALKGKLSYDPESKKAELQDGASIKVITSKKNKEVAVFSAEAPSGKTIGVEIIDKSSGDVINAKQPNTVYYNPTTKEAHAFGIASTSLSQIIGGQEMKTYFESSNPESFGMMRIKDKSFPALVTNYKEGTIIGNKVQISGSDPNNYVDHKITIEREGLDAYPAVMFSKIQSKGVWESVISPLEALSNIPYQGKFMKDAPFIMVLDDGAQLPQQGITDDFLVKEIEKAKLVGVPDKDNLYSTVVKDAYGPKPVKVGLGIRTRQPVELGFSGIVNSEIFGGFFKGLSEINYKEDPYPEFKQKAAEWGVTSLKESPAETSKDALPLLPRQGSETNIPSATAPPQPSPAPAVASAGTSEEEKKPAPTQIPQPGVSPPVAPSALASPASTTPQKTEISNEVLSKANFALNYLTQQQDGGGFYVNNVGEVVCSQDECNLYSDGGAASFKRGEQISPILLGSTIAEREKNLQRYNIRGMDYEALKEELKPIKLRDRGPEVLAFQMFYNQMVDDEKIPGDKLAPDEIYGTNTRDAVKKVQQLVGAEDDGIFGPKTVEYLKKYIEVNELIKKFEKEKSDIEKRGSTDKIQKEVDEDRTEVINSNLKILKVAQEIPASADGYMDAVFTIETFNGVQGPTAILIANTDPKFQIISPTTHKPITGAGGKTEFTHEEVADLLQNLYTTTYRGQGPIVLRPVTEVGAANAQPSTERKYQIRTPPNNEPYSSNGRTVFTEEEVNYLLRGVIRQFAGVSGGSGITTTLAPTQGEQSNPPSEGSVTGTIGTSPTDDGLKISYSTFVRGAKPVGEAEYSGSTKEDMTVKVTLGITIDGKQYTETAVGTCNPNIALSASHCKTLAYETAKTLAYSRLAQRLVKGP